VWFCEPGELAIRSLLLQTLTASKILEWQPRYDDLDKIIGHALEWERHLLVSD
jgi:hypothetical protein